MIDEARAQRERNLFYDEQRARIGRADALSITGAVLFVLVALRDPYILVWAAVVFTQVLCGFAVYLVAKGEVQPTWLKLAETWWFRGTSFTWAIMPVLVFDQVSDLGVAWIIAFFVIFGLASDAIFLPQTYDINLVTSGISYSAPALMVLALHGQWVPFAAIIGILLHVTATANGITQIVHGLIEKGLEARDAGADAIEKALTDSLTSLYNRAGIVAVIDRLRTEESTQKISVCFIDLNGFKAVNDQFGYLCGDTTLVRFGNALTEVLPTGWSAGRFGGDEFVVAGPGDAGPQVAQAIAAITVSPIDSPSARLVSASVGVSVANASEVDSLTMLHFAGTAVREAKHTPGVVVMHSSAQMQERSARRARLCAELPEALSTGAIVAVGQPQIDLATGTLSGIELLARWHRNEENVPPSEFVPLISRLGLDRDFDLLMVQHALDVLGQTSEASLQVSVNISTNRIATEGFADTIRDMIEAAGIDATRLTLEVTESDDLSLDVDTLARIGELVDLGVRLSIDDFGTGYSSLTRLVSIPFSELKLDLSLVQRLGEPGADDLIRSISDFALRNDIEVVAEGVETNQQFDAIVDLGIRRGQGYLFGRPVAVDELLAVYEAIDWSWSSHQAA